MVAGGALAVGASVAAALWLPRVPAWRRAQYGRRVESGVAAATLAMSAALAGGGSIRAAIGGAARELEGPISVELRRAAIELEAGGPLDDALDGLIARAPSRSVIRVAAAIQLQRRSGGDLASLLRRIAASLEEERRAAEEARAATSQARVTSHMVLALPVCGLAFAELAAPGLVGRMLGSSVGAACLVTALCLQVVGALAVRRLARTGL
jgi:tight adherence protein B